MGTVGDRVHKLRLRAGLHGEELGKLAGMSPAYVGNLERGEISMPSGTSLLRLATALGTTVEYLVSGKGKAPTKQEILEAIKGLK